MSRVYETSDERGAILGNIVEDKENLILSPKIFGFSLKITAVLLCEREFCPSFTIKQLLYRIEGWSVFNCVLPSVKRFSSRSSQFWWNLPAAWTGCIETNDATVQAHNAFNVSDSRWWKWSIQLSLASVSLQSLGCFYMMIYGSWSVIYKEIYKEKMWMSTKDRRALLSCQRNWKCPLFTR